VVVTGNMCCERESWWAAGAAARRQVGVTRTTEPRRPWMGAEEVREGVLRRRGEAGDHMHGGARVIPAVYCDAMGPLQPMEEKGASAAANS
jgi:hypothetical protein